MPQRSLGDFEIFATHSPAILSAVPPDQVFEVTRSDGVSRVKRMATTEEVFSGLRELGYRPSLLQMADAVLFVEGLNDVAAIRIWWRKLFDEDPEAPGCSTSTGRLGNAPPAACYRQGPSVDAVSRFSTATVQPRKLC
ncbi:MAG: hypothetical protein ABSF89_18105 [Acidimicrobiales bacterium]